MDITVTTKFDIGDKVWVKSQLDKYLETTNNMDLFLSFYVPHMLFEITDIKVTASQQSGEEELIVYDLEFTVPASDVYTATVQMTGRNNITEDNLYSLEEGRTAIKNKLTDFETNLDAL